MRYVLLGLWVTPLEIRRTGQELSDTLWKPIKAEPSLDCFIFKSYARFYDEGIGFFCFDQITYIYGVLVRHLLWFMFNAVSNVHLKNWFNISLCLMVVFSSLKAMTCETEMRWIKSMMYSVYVCIHQICKIYRWWNYIVVLILLVVIASFYFMHVCMYKE